MLRKNKLFSRVSRRITTVVAALVAVATMAGTAPAWAALTGPDVSSWQHPKDAAINWQQVKNAGHNFAFIKATEGPGPRNGNTWYTNPYFAQDWRQVGAVGLTRGAYHYAQPMQPVATTALEQARYYVSVTGTMHGDHDLPPVLDFEESNGLSPSDLGTWARTWLQEVQRLTGRRPMIYTYLNFWKVQMANTTGLSEYKLWFARYTNDPSQTTPPGGWQTWTFWQYTASATVPGIPGGNVDLSRYCCSVSNLRALAYGSGASDYASNPFGHWDHSFRQPGGLAVQGWAIDPDTTDAVRIDPYVDGHVRQSIIADAASPDVAAAYPGFGDHHRFTAVVPALGGQHHVCLYAINQGYGHGNPKLDCRLVTLSSTPYGNVDQVVQQLDGVLVRGWAIDPDVSDPVWVHVTVDGQVVTAFHANETRTDIGRAYPGYGDNHGYSGVIPISQPGEHRVCVYAINILGTSVNPNTGCKTVDFSTTPKGHLDAVNVEPDGVVVRGWALDPTTTDAIAVHAYVDGAVVKGFLANNPRPDVGRAYPGYGDDHGFSGFVPVSGAGPHKVCVYAIAATSSGGHPELGCQTVG